MLYEDLKNNLFLEIPYPDSLTELIGTAEPWKAFCELPLELKQRFARLPDSDDAEAGYQLRSKAEGREDKEYFHFYPNYAQQIQSGNLEDLVAQTPAISDFFEYGSRIHTAIVNFSDDLSRKLGVELPQLRELLDNGELRYLLRFLHYTSQSEPIIAAQHYDRSLYTLHIYESAEGLQFLDWNMQWKDAPIAPGKTVLFTGYRLEQLTNGEAQKTWHRVVGTERNQGRISIVLFLWSPSVPDYPKDVRSQEEVPSYRR